MTKFISIVCFLFLNLNASIINFQEEKYIEVIDNTVYKKGTLEFIDKKISLKYNNSNRILIYENDSLIINDGDDTQSIDLNKQVTLKMIFLLIESINNNNLKALQEYFEVSTKNKITNLNPKDSLSNYIENVEFKKDKKLDFITIKMTSGNITTIRELND
ncbi:hypothetical protein KO488_06890 [Poseidonibacter lekithochrous]|uniref:hypothetical protein n=1 Tax=Poseidonibacter TaxID=2321187 RepID=UPI001C094D41|nr:MULTISPECIES: hypothetical protein [Poseidonibacter]MBU3014480.1 hypothetical protein [Poseidonibacter lekithochrous]MDO6827778.1 hypothetical protein [Poseidonibacter sp. 1_MG-2023]